MKKTFEDLTEKLNKSMHNDYEAVSKKYNSVWHARNTLTQPQLAYVLGQYSLFPKEIVGLLRRTKESAYNSGWQAVVDEMERNIGEEEGSDTSGVSHYEMLLQGVKESAGIDLTRVDERRATREFLSAMRHHTNERANHPVYVLGATYALESSAVPELEMVVELTKDLVEKSTGRRELSPTLQRFFDDHLHTWEVGHESRLREACDKHLRYADYRDFEAGFRGTLYAMSCWWNGLAHEAKRK